MENGGPNDEALRTAEVAVVTLSMATTPFLTSLLERLLASRSDDRPFDVPDDDARPLAIAG